jgi:hypothetical protein
VRNCEVVNQQASSIRRPDLRASGSDAIGLDANIDGMTLIVARVTPKGIWLSSDMRVTDPSAANAPGFLNAALKLILVSPTLCIGYAGGVAAALAAIRRVDAEEMAPDAAVDYLLGIHLNDPTVDFVVASVHPSVLVEIKNGQAADGQAAWLGDPDAFDRYQELYHGEHFLPPSEGLDPGHKSDLDIAVRMNDAMQDLVLASAEPDGPGASHALVGEASVTVGPRVEDGQLKYHLYSNYSAPHASEIPPSGSLMSTERGSFSISFLAPEQPGIGAIGLSFPEGQLGILYAPLMTERADQPDRFHPVTIDEFADKVKARYGVSLRGVDGSHSSPSAPG